MNERIRQLWSQAGEEIEAEYEDESRRNRRLYNEIFLPKFAELIVRECASIASGTAVENPPNDLFYGYNLGVNKTAEKIKQHFGVEL
jgi:hypothetical protein